MPRILGADPSETFHRWKSLARRRDKCFSKLNANKNLKSFAGGRLNALLSQDLIPSINMILVLK